MTLLGNVHIYYTVDNVELETGTIGVKLEIDSRSFKHRGIVATLNIMNLPKDAIGPIIISSDCLKNSL